MSPVRSPSRSLRVALIAVVLVVIGAPARAQTGVEVSGTAGAAGWLDPDEPFGVAIRIESEVLFDGVIETSMGGIEITTPAQVPAGTSKTYDVRMPPPTGQTLRVTLRDQRGDTVASSTVSTRIPTDEVFVGVSPGLDTEPFARLTTPIVRRPLVALDFASADGRLGLFEHLVLSNDDVDATVMDWVESGGTLVTDRVPEVSLQPMTQEGDAVGYLAGEGVVVVVDALADPEGYADFLLAGPLDSGRRDAWQSPDQALAEAASNSGSGGIPELPWLLGAIVAYAILVGPVNFFVLHRTGRRDFAWITIPAISALALGGFWVVGTERLDQVSVSHATLVMAGDRPTVRSSVVLAVGSPGVFELAFDDGALVYPGSIGNNFDQFGRPVVVGRASIEGSVARFELDQLGFAAASAIAESVPAVPLAALDAGNDSVIVDNVTDLEFWAWGVSNGSLISAQRAPLTPGSAATVAVGAIDRADAFREPGFGLNVGDAIVGELQLWNDERGWQVLSPIGRAAQFSFEETPGMFWFGFTEDFHPGLALDDQPIDPLGTTLVIVPIDATDAGSGSEQGILIDVGDGFVENGGGAGDVFVSSDEMWLGFDLPHGAVPTEISFIDQFGMRPGSFELWDWEAARLERVQVGQTVDRRFTDPAGRLVMRVAAAGAVGVPDEGFVEIPMSPRSVSIGWEAG